MSGDPADIGGAPKNIFIPNVEDVFRGAVNPDEIAARGVENSFRFSGRTAGVKNVKRMLAVERHRRGISIDIFQLAMPPHVAAFFHVNVASGASKDNYAFDRLVAAKRIINIFFQRNNSPAPIAAVRSNQGDRATIGNSVTNAVRAKSTEDDGVNRADTRASQHGNDCFRNRRQINDDAITFADSVSFEHVRKPANLMMKLLVS